MEKISKVPIYNTLYLILVGMWFTLGVQKLAVLTEHGGRGLLLTAILNFAVGTLYIYLGRKLKG